MRIYWQVTGAAEDIETFTVSVPDGNQEELSTVLDGVIGHDQLVHDTFLAAPHHPVWHRAIKDVELLTRAVEMMSQFAIINR